MTIIAGIPCPNERCAAVIPPPVQTSFLDYFEGRPWVCPRCNHTEDLWSLLRARVLDDHRLMPSIVSLGLGAITHITHPLEPETVFTVDLEEHGVPGDATIVDIVLTPNSSGEASPLAPALVIQHLHTRGLSPLLRVNPVRWFPETEHSTNYAATELSIMAIWLPPPPEPEIEPLLSAAKAFTTNDFRGAIVPAQIAVELKMSQVLTAHFGQFGSKDDVQSFLNNGATYGHQLRFLVPSLFGAVGAPELPEDVRVALQSLRKKRNQVGHEHAATERSEAGLMLLAALFGYWYLRIYGSRLSPAPTSASV